MAAQLPRPTGPRRFRKASGSAHHWEDGPPATAAETSPAGERRRGRRRALLRIGVFAFVLGGLFLASAVAGLRPSPERIREWAEGFGGLGALVFVPLAAVLNCLGVPSWVLAPSAGLLFGTVLGTPVVLGALVLAAAVQMAVGRYLAGDQVGRMLPARARRFDEFLERRGFFAVLYLRLIPGAPFVSANYAAGLTRLRMRDLTAATAIGSAPRIFAYVALGKSITDLGAPEAKIAVGLLVAAAVGGALLARRQLAAERRERMPASERREGAPAPDDSLEPSGHSTSYAAEIGAAGDGLPAERGRPAQRATADGGSGG